MRSYVVRSKTVARRLKGRARPVAKSTAQKAKTEHQPVQAEDRCAEPVEEVICGRWRKNPHGRAVRKSDTGEVAAVNREMMKALRQSPDIIAKVGNSYKKRLKVASRVEMSPHCWRKFRSSEMQ